MRFLPVVLALSLAVPLHATQKELDRALGRINASKKPAEALEPFLFIMARASEAPAMHLFLASTVAIANDRIEDAAFLFYAAQLRTRFDMARYPAKGKGSDSPAVLLGALNQQVGAAVNPAIMREPRLMAAAVKRVAAYRPVTPKDYDPGWAFTTTSADAANARFAENHASFMRQVGGMSTLLLDPEYFEAFKTVQTLNFAPDPKRSREKAAAEAKMLAIEKKKGIEGIFYRK